MTTHTDNAAKPFVAFGKTYRSEREAILGLIETCKIPALRGGLKIIAEREAFHGRVFQQRIRELGSECRTELDPFSQANEACIYNTGLTDLEKLTELVERAGDPDIFLRPILDFAETIADDVESKEALKLYYADEISSAHWLRDICHKLTAATQVSQAA
jgi:hypothetical protein